MTRQTVGAVVKYIGLASAFVLTIAGAVMVILTLAMAIWRLPEPDTGVHGILILFGLVIFLAIEIGITCGGWNLFWFIWRKL